MKKKTAAARVSARLVIYSSVGLERSFGGVGRDTAVEPGENGARRHRGGARRHLVVRGK